MMRYGRYLLVIIFLIGAVYFPFHARAAAAYVQSAEVVDYFTATTNTESLTFTTQNVTTGNLIAVVVWWNSTTVTLSGVSDNCGNAYILVGGPTVSNAYSVQGAYAQNVTGGSKCQVTATLSGAVGNRAMAIDEISGIDTASPLDGNIGTFKSITSNGTDVLTSGNFSTTVNGDYILGAMIDPNGDGHVISAGTGYAIRGASDMTHNVALTLEDQIQATAGGSTRITFSFNTGFSQALMIGVAFKPASGSVGVTPPPTPPPQSPPPADTTPPSTPAGVSATAISSSEIDLSWSASTDNVGVTGYKIYRGGVQVGTATTNSYSDTGLAPSTLYSYTVSAYDAAGNDSAQSASTNAMTMQQSVPGYLIDSSRAINWSHAGATITNRNTICSTLGVAGQLPSYAQSVTAAQINSAISSCSNGVVLLNPGTYALSGQISISKNDVTLRGSGPDQTKIVPTAGGGCGNTTSLICISRDGNWTGGPDHLTNWTAGYAQGTTVITLASVSGLSVGQVLILDQQDDVSDTGNIYICGTLAATCSSEGQASGGGRGGNHAQMQYALVTAINGTNVTISPGLYMPNWTSAKGPAAWWATTLAQNIGIENLSIDNRTAGAGSITVFNNAYNSWIKNITSIGGGSRSHVDLQFSPNITVRDSYFWGAHGANLSYGVETWMSGNELVENNIFQHLTTPLLIGAGAGSVYAYNYAIDIYTTSPTWLYASADDHDPGTEMNLFEGNVMPSMLQDAIHGSHAMETYFRNRLSGRDTANSQTQQTVPLLLQSFSRYTNFIGNVLGTSGYHNNYQANYGGSSNNCNTSIYNMGWGGTSCGSGSVNPDSLVISTVMRWGNYDTVTGQAQWNTNEVPSALSQYANLLPANHNLPASLYLSTKPSWWSVATPWPAIGPDVTGGNIAGVGGHAYIIPAEACYNSMGGPVDSPGNPLTFNASNCYISGGSTPPADTTPPTTSVIAPLNNATVSGTTSVTASASDNVGVTKVELYVDGTLQSSLTASPYTFSLNTASFTNGSHTLSAKAYDAAGNVGTSGNVSVTVSNAPQTTSSSTPTPSSTSSFQILSATVSNITDTSAQVTITTSQPASVVLNYGPTTNYGQTLAASPYLTTIYENLTGLSPNTVYDFQVIATPQGTSTSLTSQNYVFTTQATPVTTSGGGGGGTSSGSSGGGGGGGGVSAPSPSSGSGSSSGGASGSGISSGSSSSGTTPPSPSAPSLPPAFPRNLTLDDTGSDVLLLQTLLKSMDYFPSTFTPTTYFGSLTQHALLLFQRDHQLNRSGFLDLQSQTLLNKVAAAQGMGGGGTTTTTIATSTAPIIPTKGSFTRYLTVGSRGQDVTLLQQLLIKDNDYPEGIVSGYFGLLTQAAVRRFQAKYGIVSSGTPGTTGYGAVGPKTRGKMNGM